VYKAFRQDAYGFDKSSTSNSVALYRSFQSLEKLSTTYLRESSGERLRTAGLQRETVLGRLWNRLTVRLFGRPIKLSHPLPLALYSTVTVRWASAPSTAFTQLFRNFSSGPRTDPLAPTHNHPEKSTTRPRAAKAFHKKHREEVGNAFETVSTWYEAQNGYIGAYSRTRTSALRKFNLVWPIQHHYEPYT
jgi:hypothetical protein